MDENLIIPVGRLCLSFEAGGLPRAAPGQTCPTLKIQFPMNKPEGKTHDHPVPSSRLTVRAGRKRRFFQAG
jgi:hypothetical protein